MSEWIMWLILAFVGLGICISKAMGAPEICHWKVCTVIQGEPGAQACPIETSGSKKEFLEFVKTHTGRGKLLFAECTDSGTSLYWKNRGVIYPKEKK